MSHIQKLPVILYFKSESNDGDPVISQRNSWAVTPVHNHGHCRPLTLLAGRDALQFEGLFATRAALRGTEQLRVTYGQSAGTPARADLDLLHA